MLWVCLFTPDTGYIYHTQQCLSLLLRLRRDGMLTAMKLLIRFDLCG